MHRLAWTSTAFPVLNSNFDILDSIKKPAKIWVMAPTYYWDRAIAIWPYFILLIVWWIQTAFCRSQPIFAFSILYCLCMGFFTFSADRGRLKFPAIESYSTKHNQHISVVSWIFLNHRSFGAPHFLVEVAIAQRQRLSCLLWKSKDLMFISSKWGSQLFAWFVAWRRSEPRIFICSFIRSRLLCLILG